MKNKGIFTSESVTEGHPDKICDQVSDAILDACLEQDKGARVACECFTGKGFILVGGEITTTAVVNYDEVVRNTIEDIGYDKPGLGFNADEIAVNIMINKQSPDIALGTNDEVNGAGDQGIMFGYACNETDELMPLPISLAHKLTRKLAEQRKNGNLHWARPDGKAQVSVVYENGKPSYVDTILISTQHDEGVTNEKIKEDLLEFVITPIFGNIQSTKTKILINPTGRFVTGGPVADTGLTGRKIIVDSYGGYSRHGGGAWSGKDPTKVDRSASYMARYLAKNIVAAELADRCEIQLAYAIGVSEPVSIYIDTFGTGVVAEDTITKHIRDMFDLTPSGIIKYLKLREQKYSKLAAYGHVGRVDIETEWEKLKSVDTFKKLLG